MLYTVYCGLGTLLFPLVIVVYLARARTRARLSERLGWWRFPPQEVIWFHGASVGEINGLIPIIERTRQAVPGARLLLTSGTMTGLQRGASYVDETRVLPIDHPWCIRLALRGLSIRCFVYGETELWPALLTILAERGVPMFLVNARISDRTLRSYLRFRSLFSPLLAAHACIAAGDADSYERFLCLGAPPAITQLCGNAKYDLPLAVRSPAEKQRFEASFFNARSPVLVLASIRPGEEEWWFTAMQRALHDGKAFSVIVAPRHQEKVEYFAAALATAGLAFVKRSEQVQVGPTERPIILLDTMGELSRVYPLAALVFVGASLVDIGGHNPLEVAMHGVPVCMGPHVQNVRGIVRDLEAVQAFHAVRTKLDVDRLFERFLAGDASLTHAGQRGVAVWRNNLGAADRIFAQLSACLPPVRAPERGVA